MKLLLVKTSSLGDLAHTLPAITEAAQRCPGLTLDWLVEESFTDLARLHPAVRRVIPVATRRWRRRLLAGTQEVRALGKSLQKEAYDLALDSQGLIKSAWLARLARARIHGFDRRSAREGLATLAYHAVHAVARGQHALLRQKALFGAVLGYEAAMKQVDYGLGKPGKGAASREIVFLHSASWPSKEWPEAFWQALAAKAVAAGYQLALPAGTAAEIARARRLAAPVKGRTLEARPLREVIACIQQAAAVVSLDTGLGHVAAAFDKPLVGIYGATSAALTGMTGAATQTLASRHLPCIPCQQRRCKYPVAAIHPPCYQRITAEKVWQALLRQMGKAGAA